VSARERRTPRDARRRSLGQNFLEVSLAERLIAEADFRPGELVLEIGAGLGAFTAPLARRGVELVAIELDPVWAARLRARAPALGPRVRVVEADFERVALPQRPFRAFGSLPFARTTDVLRRLLDDPRVPLQRADLIVQWEVARKRAAVPPQTLRSAAWAPWWEFRQGPRIPAAAFRPVPRVDAAVLVVTRRAPPLLPPAMAYAFARFVRGAWPFDAPPPGAPLCERARHSRRHGSEKEEGSA
jgi:23S rRNA (adenine-N6)-dimethyltransferase